MDIHNFKDPASYQEYLKAPELLKWLIGDFENQSIAQGVFPFCTRILGKIEGDTGIHALYLAVDWRLEHEGRSIYTTNQKDAILGGINGKWPRNDGKLTIIVHSFQGGPKHFHMQLPPETKTLWRK